MMGVAAFARSASLSLSLAAVATVPCAMAAESSLSAYQGAWLQGGGSCSEVYSFTTKGTSFRKPVDIFAPAFIISGNRIRTPQASCRVKAIRSVGDRQVLTLGCANAVSSNDLTVQMSAAPDGTLRRYFNAQDTMGSIYQRCSQ
jgi:hypothetical protein